MQNRLFIHATNVHQGGGRSLLLALLKASHGKSRLVLSLDERMPLPEGIEPNVQIKQVKASIVQRLKAEQWLAQNVTQEDVVLCFGNLPPLFKLRGHTMVFVQNRYLVDNTKLKGLPLKARLRLAMERLWLTKRMSNADVLIVQTPSMKRLLENKMQGKVPVRMLPFVEEPDGYTRSLPQVKVPEEKEISFVYVASGEPHKNHRRLIEAWCLLAKDGLYPSLCVTLNEVRFASLCNDIEILNKRHGIKITNAGELPHQDVRVLYKKADAAIYPSTFESFGLPLLEARQAGLQILASEMDYVRDVLDPEQTFDPDSSISIARAVKRFMGKEEQALQLLDANGFIERIVS